MNNVVDIYSQATVRSQSDVPLANSSRWNFGFASRHESIDILVQAYGVKVTGMAGNGMVTFNPLIATNIAAPELATVVGLTGVDGDGQDVELEHIRCLEARHAGGGASYITFYYGQDSYFWIPLPEGARCGLEGQYLIDNVEVCGDFQQAVAATLFTGNGSSSIRYNAVEPGVAGNSITVEVSERGTGTGLVDVAVDGTDITIGCRRIHAVPLTEIDWTHAASHKTLALNSTFTFSNIAPSSAIELYVTYGGFGVNWPVGITWADGEPPIGGIKLVNFTTDESSNVSGSWQTVGSVPASATGQDLGAAILANPDAAALVGVAYGGTGRWDPPPSIARTNLAEGADAEADPAEVDIVVIGRKLVQG